MASVIVDLSTGATSVCFASLPLARLTNWPAREGACVRPLCPPGGKHLLPVCNKCCCPTINSLVIGLKGRLNLAPTSRISPNLVANRRRPRLRQKRLAGVDRQKIAPADDDISISFDNNGKRAIQSGPHRRTKRAELLFNLANSNLRPFDKDITKALQRWQVK